MSSNKNYIFQPVLIFLISFIVFHNYSCTSNYKGDIKNQLPDTINVAVELSSMTLLTNGDTISGFSFELFEKLCRNHEQPFSITTFNNISDITNKPGRKEFNLFVSNIPITSDIKDQFIVTEPLYVDKLVLIQNKNIQSDSLIKTQQDLGDRTIWIAGNKVVRSRLENLSQEIGKPIVIVDVDDVSEEQLLILINQGQVPRGAVSRLTALALIKDYPDIDMSVDLSFNQFKSWFLPRKDSILRDSLNSWIESYKATPDYEELVKKYRIND